VNDDSITGIEQGIHGANSRGERDRRIVIRIGGKAQGVVQVKTIRFHLVYVIVPAMNPKDLHDKVVAAMQAYAKGGQALWERIAETEAGLDPSLLGQMVQHKKVEGVSVSKNVSSPFGPEIRDLMSLWVLTQAIKPIVTLELGSGFSTKILASSAHRLQARMGDLPFNTQRSGEHPFHVWSIDESRKWARIARARLARHEGQHATILHSTVKVSEIGPILTTQYAKLPNIKPDFIYLDGPSQYSTSKKLNGLALNESWRMPLSSDVLRLEWLLEPGAVVCIDGRMQNVQFLKQNLQREWQVEHFEELDQTVMTLVAPVLGKQNQLKLDWQIRS